MFRTTPLCSTACCVCVCVYQAAAYASSDGVLTEKMIDEIVAEAVRAHKKKFDWCVEHDSKTVSTSSVPRSAKDIAAFTPPVAQSQSAIS